jgi:hypothetical protein
MDLRISRKLRLFAFLATGLAGLTCASVAFARQELVPGSRFTSARAAALGDAFLPLGEDGAAALFVNPAAVGKIRGGQVDVNFGLETSSGFVDSAGLTSYNIYSLSANKANLTAHPNTQQGMGLSLLPTFSGKGFAIGVLAENQFVATADAAGNVRYHSLYQLIPAAAFGVRLAGGIVRLGYGLQYVHKAEGEVSVPSGAADLGYNQSLPQGSGLSHTVGFALTLPLAYLPAVNLVARNVFNTSYSSWSMIPIAANSPGAPATDKMSFDASFSLQPKIEQGAYFNIVGQYRDILNTSGMAMFGRLAGGLELSMRDFFFIRTGYGSGYPAAGIGFRMKRGEFNATWYSEELGQGYHQLRDLRYMFQFKMRSF